MEKAMIAMSGGVDSSVAALLTAREGFACIGCTMRLFDNEAAGIDRESGCCSLSDVEDAQAVARRMGIPFYAFNFTGDFRREVMEPFASEYRAGRTPNPCIRCNRTMKFEKLLGRARELGCVRLVTGHYARTAFENGRWTLKKALDAARDQSYVLYMLTQEQLAMVRFPLGELTKAQVRDIAEENGFVNARKPDSQDICFVPDGDYAAAIGRITGTASVPGDFVDEEGNVLGRHRGLDHYTVGQRRPGLYEGRKLYISRIDAAHNVVELALWEELFKTELTAVNFNWLIDPTPGVPFSATVRVRHTKWEEPPCTATAKEDGTVLIRCEDPVRAPAPGQSAVLYDGDRLLGGGFLK